jgi:hypothetical protein
MLRLYRIRISEGKRGLPGYWELETELWDPMMWRDKILVTVYGAFVFSVYLALLILQKLPAEFAVGFPSLPAFATVTYIMACYPKYQKRGKKALIKGDRADHQSLDCEYDDFDRRGGL